MLALAATLFACGDNEAGLPLESFETSILHARCERLTRCGQFADVDTCDAYFRKRPNLDLEAALAAGVVRYSGPAASLCIAELAAQSCDTSSRDARVPPDVCLHVFTGTRAEGDHCTLDEECASGSCDSPPCGSPCCPGQCRPNRTPAPAGAQCELDRDCRHDLFCGRDGTCHGLGGDGALCADDNECDYGFACIGPSELMEGNCRKQPAIGEPCLYQRCADLGAFCNAGTCSPSGLPGARCTSSKDCSPFMLCDATLESCVDVPRLGAACTTICAGEAWCDNETETCAEPKQNAEPCSAGDQCESLFCEEGVVFDACGPMPRCFTP